MRATHCVDVCAGSGHASCSMRVGLVVTGGVDRSARERVMPVLLWLIERLARAHEVHVFALHHETRPTTYPLLGATVHDLGRVTAPPGLRRFVQRHRLLRAVHAIGGADVLHGYWGLPGAAAVHVASQLRIPSIVTANSGEFVSLPDIGYGLQRRWMDRHAVRYAMTRAGAVTVASTFMQRLAAQHGVNARVIPMGVPRRLDAHGHDVVPARPPEGPPWRLIHVASINRVKDHDTLLCAMADIVATIPEVHLDIVGADTRDGHVSALVRALRLEGHVTLHGFMTNDQLEPLWARAHVHIVSSRHEAAGIVTLEAAVAGVPTVGTQVGYVADGAPHRAVAVPVRDASALASAVVTLLGDPVRRAQLASTARTWALAHDADLTAQAFGALYREVRREATNA